MSAVKLVAAAPVQFDAGFDAGAGGPVRAGVWDRWTSWGEKIKDGSTTVFNESTLSQAVENFRAQQNDLYMDYDHQSAYVAENGKPAIALAWYCALAVVRGGQVIAFASHREGVQPPNPTGGEDGLYAFRHEVTDAGQQLLSGGKYRYLSPMFDPDGHDEKGNPVGYLFYCCAATNNPFQDGVEITFTKGASGAAKRTKSMAKNDDGSIYKRLGLDADSSPESAMAAMRGYFARMDEGAGAEKLAEEDPEDKPKMSEEKPDEKMAEEPGEKMAEEPADDEDKKVKQSMADDVDAMSDEEAMKKMARDLGCAPKLSAMADAVSMMKLSHAPKTTIARLSRELADVKAKLAEQEKAKRHDEAVKFAKTAIGDGRWNPAEENDLVEARVENPKLAEKALSPKGTWTVLSRITNGGEPVGKDRVERENFDTPFVEEGSDVGSQVSALAKKYAQDNKVSFADALNHIANTQPQLYSKSLHR